MEGIELGYWGIRGLAQPIRLMLEYLEIDYEESIYKCGGAPSYDRSEWTEVKDHLGLVFPALPYLIHHDNRITQSNAIARYIACENELVGSDSEAKTLCDMIAEDLSHLRDEWVRLCYNPGFEDRVAEWLELVPVKFAAYEKLANGAEGAWVTGESLTWVDFVLYELVDQIMTMDPTAFLSLPHLCAYHRNFQELPTIKAYLGSDRFRQHPINNPMAKWGGSIPRTQK
eukprot:TRINITY_DN19288_c0_g1_i4.p1 TRINITY_DN19288_c0_g1~~TRINITY_DN19288_c0_g1_i4.p1  ORF type:complete len:228 (-),score=64.38 TRINITY_DN19288_c0_g1_i4:307-990(-)